MNRNEFKVFVDEMNGIYFSMDWFALKVVDDEVFNGDREMPDSLKDQLAILIGEISA